MRDYTNVIIAPVITEKSAIQKENNVYTFKVAKDANKIQIKKAIEAAFGVKVKNVNTKAKEVEITVNPQDVNNVVGYKRENINKLKEFYDLDVVIKQDIKQSPNKIDVRISKKHKDFKDDDENI